MVDNRKRDRAWVGGFLVGGLIAAIVVNSVMVRWPVSGVDWYGDTGVVASMAAILGVLGAGAAFLGVLLSNKRSRESLDLARRAEVATRFQKGADLLTNRLTGVAGVATLEQVVHDEPETYWAPCLRTLAHFVRENEYDSERQPVDPPDDYDPEAEKWADTKPATTSALIAVGRILNRHDDMRQADPLGDLLSGRYPVSGVYLSGFDLYDVDLRNLEITELVLRSTEISKSDLRNSILQGHVFRSATFSECRLDGVQMSLADANGRPVTFRKLNFENCSGTETATINRLPLTTWIARSQARRTAFVERESRTVIVPRE